ncbi:MAG: hypothetical protein ABIJ56_00260 [Pseudomonadota bacterium]
MENKTFYTQAALLFMLSAALAWGCGGGDSGSGEDAAADTEPDTPVELDDGPCTDGQFECLADGTARKCFGDTWGPQVRCPLGCDAAAQACFVPSNIAADARDNVFNADLLDISLAGASSPVTINSDDGSITDAMGSAIRPAGTGTQGGILYMNAPQEGSPSSSAGLFIMKSLDVPAGVTVSGVGSNPIILYIRESASIAGTIDVGATRPSSMVTADGHHTPGAGGFAGGEAETQGLGPCPGGADGGSACGQFTTSGGGGGGFGGRGGDGGDGADPSYSCTTVYYGGDGGGPCPSAGLLPLIGGSGGGGGGMAEGSTSQPGKGGAGGGAIQISALQLIHLLTGGIITAPGGGGGGADNNGGGGGGGGAGGGILLESPDITLDPASIVAATGGGGGSGDCS